MDLLDPFPVQSPAVTLISDGGIGEAVAKNGLSLLERGENDLGDMLGPCGRIEKILGRRLHAAVLRGEEDLADPISDCRSSGLPGQQEGKALFLQVGGQVADLGRLAAAFDAFKRDKEAQNPSA